MKCPFHGRRFCHASGGFVTRLPEASYPSFRTERSRVRNPSSPPPTLKAAHPSFRMERSAVRNPSFSFSPNESGTRDGRGRQEKAGGGNRHEWRVARTRGRGAAPFVFKGAGFGFSAFTHRWNFSPHETKAQLLSVRRTANYERQTGTHRASRSTSLIGKSQCASRISKRRCSSFL